MKLFPPAQPRPAAPAGAGFRKLAEPKQRTLIWSDFTAGSPVADVMSAVAYRDVALGYASGLKPGSALRAYLKSKYELAITVDAATTYTVDLGALGIKLVLSTKTAPALPTNAHPDLVAYISSDAGTSWAKTDITAINTAASTVTITKTASATNRVKLYYLSGNGEIQLSVRKPQGSDVFNSKVFGKPQRELYELDQTNERSAPKLTLPRPALLPPQWRLQLEARAPHTIAWVAEAEHDLSIPVYDAPVQVYDVAQFNRVVEANLQGGF